MSVTHADTQIPRTPWSIAGPSWFRKASESGNVEDSLGSKQGAPKTTLLTYPELYINYLALTFFFLTVDISEFP